MDPDLLSIQQARELVAAARTAQLAFRDASQDVVDRIVERMADSGARAAEKLARHACSETGFGRVDSKIQKNLFATTTLLERMEGMKTCGIINRVENDSIWEIAVPMGVVAGLVPSTNPTSTAMYKAIIAAKARCGIVLSPHPRAAQSTNAALQIVANAAYAAGAPKGLFGCLTHVSMAGTNELLENRGTDVILATGGTPMVKAAYSKGKPAYGVGSGNVPVYVDRSADIDKAAADILYGVSFDWGTLCSTERSVVADEPIARRLIDSMQLQGACFLDSEQANLLRHYAVPGGRVNIEQVGKSPFEIARAAGFDVPAETRALVVEVDEVGKQEPLSMETLSPILSFYREDGWEAGCERCLQVLDFGGMGHTLAIHCTRQRILEAFALEKPAMRIVVNTVAALGSVGYTNKLFPAMTLGPGTAGGSITSDNISPLHLINIKRMAFETNPINHPSLSKSGGSGNAEYSQASRHTAKWIETVEGRISRQVNTAAKPAQFSRNRDLDAQTKRRPPVSEGQSRRRQDTGQVADGIQIAEDAPPALDEMTIRKLITQFAR